YLVAGLTKLIVTKGLWIFQARNIAVEIAKTAHQTFYDRVDGAHLQEQLTVAHFAAAHGWWIVLIAGGGLFLELGSPLMLVNRLLAALFGCALLGFHLALDRVIGLVFG